MSQDPKFQIKCLKSTDGTIRYVREGKLHNPDGPAVIHPDGKEEYFINGSSFTQDAWKKAKKDANGLPWYKSGVAKTRF